ncbi:hypothetical protein IWQ60_005748 [Tieghemiomyces parasiticus]|uniref:Uncharacterized protein n=1 Tax=Tieghemiomyces parasiticus TaxID=78921 RepID=A0A9W8AB69_9FUNG|nr:hypothetical protein IWQ60_005748 [Tieghemiomyces parasiticus]
MEGTAEIPEYYIGRRVGNRFSTRPDLRAKYFRRMHRPERLKPSMGQRKIHFMAHVVCAEDGALNTRPMLEYKGREPPANLVYCFTSVANLPPTLRRTQPSPTGLQQWHRRKLDEFWNLTPEEKEEFKDLSKK